MARILSTAGIVSCLAVATVAHIQREVSHCVEISKSTAELEECHINAMRDPEWVAKYSTAASGPEQISINYGSSPDSMTIGWATSDTNAQSIVEWGTSSGNSPNKVSKIHYFFMPISKVWNTNSHVTFTPLGLTPGSSL